MSLISPEILGQLLSHTALIQTLRVVQENDLSKQRAIIMFRGRWDTSVFISDSFCRFNNSSKTAIFPSESLFDKRTQELQKRYVQ